MSNILNCPIYCTDSTAPDRQQGKELDTAIVLGEGIRPGIGILISWEYWGTGSDYIDRILSPMIMIGDYYWRT